MTCFHTSGGIFASKACTHVVSVSCFRVVCVAACKGRCRMNTGHNMTCCGSHILQCHRGQSSSCLSLAWLCSSHCAGNGLPNGELPQQQQQQQQQSFYSPRWTLHGQPPIRGEPTRFKNRTYPHPATQPYDVKIQQRISDIAAKT